MTPNTLEAVIRRGLAKEYLTSLLGNYEELTDEEQLLALTLATAEERLEGLNKVAHANPEAGIKLPTYLNLVGPIYTADISD